MRARLSLPRVLLPHTCTQDGWFLQPKRRPARLPRRTVPSNCICRCSRMRARLSPPRVLLPHAGWMVSATKTPTSSATSQDRHTPPPHTGFPMSAHLSRLRLFQQQLRGSVWVWVWVWDWIHSHTPPRTRSPSSRHPPFTHYPFPLRSLVCGGQPSLHKPRLVVSHSTCPPLSSSPHAHSFVLGTAVINTHHPVQYRTLSVRSSYKCKTAK
jgi:hypothetical protein